MSAALALLLLAGQQHPATDALMRGADDRLSVPCGPECEGSRPGQRYRLGDADEASGRAPRAVDDTGARCSVVGARLHPAAA